MVTCLLDLCLESPFAKMMGTGVSTPVLGRNRAKSSDLSISCLNTPPVEGGMPEEYLVNMCDIYMKIS